MKAMGVELGMYKQQVDEYRGDITMIAQQSRNLKSDWIKQISASKSSMLQ